jgi:hypothetical protein
MNEQRPVAVSVAAVICLLSSLAALSTLAAPIPRPVAYASVVAAALGLTGAYGVWRLKRWGAVLSVIVLAANAFLAAPGIPFVPNLGMQVFATAAVLFDLIGIALLVILASRRAYA